jgi:hypothetical protein
MQAARASPGRATKRASVTAFTTTLAGFLGAHSHVAAVNPALSGYHFAAKFTFRLDLSHIL